VSKIIEEDEQSSWPNWFFELAGSAADDESFLRPEQPSFDLDIPRLPL